MDSTWDYQTENSQKIYYDYFLAGGESVSTFDNLAFNESHLNSGYWESQNRYLFAYPELAGEKYDPSSNPEPDPGPDEDQIELTDETGGTGIFVIAEKDVLDWNTVLNVEEKEADPEKPNRITYNITITLNGEKVQPNGSVTVKIPMPEIFADKKCRVYYRDMTSGEEKLVDMSRVGCCIDNGPMEGFWGILKSEMYYLRKLNFADELISAIENYINFYMVIPYQQQHNIP